MGKLSSSIQVVIKAIVCLPIQAYQLAIGPFITPCCRFYPSCSQYALLAIEYYGVCKGAWKIIRRLLRCHPWALGGYDPIPELISKEKN